MLTYRRGQRTSSVTSLGRQTIDAAKMRATMVHYLVATAFSPGGQLVPRLGPPFGFGYGDGRGHALADAFAPSFPEKTSRSRRRQKAAGVRAHSQRAIARRVGILQLLSARCRSAAWTRDLDRRVDLVDDDGDQRRREAAMPNSSEGQIGRADRPSTRWWGIELIATTFTYVCPLGVGVQRHITEEVWQRAPGCDRRD